jgi:predicted ATPase/DNA-binding XRE family transcriptional regulator
MPTTAATFGALLRQHRLAAGLTQEGLAERAGLSTRGVQDLERGVRTAPRAETLRLLAEALGLSPQARTTLIGAAHPELNEAPTTLPTTPSTSSRLPRPPTSLVGRERELSGTCALFRLDPDREGTRLLTLTGPGGVGKTRLALAIASEVAGDYPDGVAWVELAPLRDPDLVLSAIAQALEVGEGGEHSLQERLETALVERRLLLVLDNCEHVLPAMPLVGDMLAAAPRLRVLATSRARLRLRGERELPIEPLALPEASGATAPSVETLAGVAAVQLFVARATEVRPGFALTPENADLVAAICRQVDGLPLALELAAARVKILPPAALRARLAQRLPLLTGGARDAPERQQTMRQAIAWSHELLSESEQILFRRLAVFAGGCTLEAAAGVAGGDRDGIDLVASLVDQSLLRQIEPPAPGAAEARFTMLETVREYAWERLEASGEAEAVRQAHAAFCLTLAERAEPELTGPAQAEWLNRLEIEHDNLRAALAWALTSDAGIALRFTAALGRFWRMHGHAREGLSWLQQALALSADTPTVARGKALEEAGRLAHDRGDPDQTEALHAAALAIWRALADRHGEARALDELGNVAHDRGDFTRAVAFHEQALALTRETGDRRGTGRALNNLGMVALYQSQDERAWQLYEEALAIMREIGDAFGANVVRNNLGIVAVRRGDLDQAAALATACLDGCQELGDEQGVGTALFNLAEVAQLQGDFEQSAALYDEARQRLQGLGDDRAVAEVCSGLATLALLQGDAARAAALVGTSLALAQRVDDQLKIAEALEGVAAVAAHRGAAERAAHVLGAAAALRERIAAPVAGHHRAAYAQLVAATRAALQPAAFAAAWDIGQEWSLDQVVAEARALTQGEVGP